MVTTAIVFWQLFPEYLLRDTTPVIGDIADHSLGPRYLRDHFLPRGSLAGWSQARFTGYPMYTFYFPFPPLVAVLFDIVFPYNVAFKLAAALGPLALPVTVFLFARLSQRSWSTSACYAAATFVVLFQPLLYNLGGSIESTALGEFSYAWSFSLAPLILGVATAGLRTGRYRALAGGLLAAALLSHVVPTATVLIGLALLTAIRPSWKKVQWTAAVVGMAVALSATWLVPLLGRLRFTAGPDGKKVSQWADWLWPDEMAPIAIVAMVGLVMAPFAAAYGKSPKRYDIELFMAAMAFTAFVLFAMMPHVPVEDTRFLPCWYLWLALLAANALSRLAEFADDWRAKAARGRPLGQPTLVRVLVPVALPLVLVPLWDSRLGDGLLSDTEGHSINTSVKFAMRGVEADPGRRELEGAINMLRAVGRTSGCGRSLSEWNRFDASSYMFHLMNLATKWTDGCMTAAVGITMQSSATSPYLRATGERLSFEPFTFVESRRHEFDLSAGLADLRLLGIRYFIASHADTQRAADASPELRFVRATPTWPEGEWKVYEVADVRLVEPLRYEPVVVPSVDRSRRTWEQAAEPWYERGAEREVVVAADGPAAWRHEARVPGVLPRKPLPGTAVSGIRIDERRVRFEVSTPGTPVLVKVSYFPNWKATGADGPYRVTPNHMVVVPRSPTVVLRYERTALDLAGSAVTVAGLAALAVFARRPPLELPKSGEPVRAPRETRAPKAVPSRRRKRGR